MVMINNQSEAQRIAIEYIASFDEAAMKGWSYRFAEMSRNGPRKDFWGAVFDVYSPEGTLVDGPLIVLVRESDGVAVTLDEAFEQGLIPLDEPT
jgi:hypothetical protein